jgi:hypothetical protein
MASNALYTFWAIRAHGGWPKDQSFREFVSIFVFCMCICLKCYFVAEPRYGCLTEKILVHGPAVCCPIVCLKDVEADQNKWHQHYTGKIILISWHGSLLVYVLFVCPLTFEHHCGLKIQVFWYIFIQVGKGKGHPCIGTEALYRPYGP